MKRLNFTKLNNLSLLHDQLLAAIPDLRPISNDQGRIDSDGNTALEAVMVVEGTATEVSLTVPDDADQAAIAAVVEAHDHTKSQPDPRQDRLARIAEIDAIARSDWTSAQMRELIHLLAQKLR